MQVLILAAGKGSRMASLTQSNHKSLLPINENDSFLSHLLHQLNEYQLSKVVIVTGYLSELVKKVVDEYQMRIQIVYNNKYEIDTNIYSMKIGLDYLSNEEPIVIFEADTYIDDLALKKIMNESEKNRSLWFTKGNFKPNQYGGILRDDKDLNISDIQIVSEYNDKFKEYKKLLGIQTIGSNEINFYKSQIDIYVKKTIEQYYLIPWIDNLDELPSLSCDLSEFMIESVNNEKEYISFISKLKEKENKNLVEISLVSIKKLLPIEDYIKERVDLLFNEISNSNWWTKPIVVDIENFLILDGHHRFQVAKKLKLKKIPVVFTKYSDVEVWSLRKSEHVDVTTVIKRAKKNNIYPNKTVKHIFKFSVPHCKIKISNLK